MRPPVGDEGSRAARLVLVGEAPGPREMEQGRPFVGPSYHERLKPWWSAVGLRREDFYITNVLDYNPADKYRGKGPDDPPINYVPRGEMEAAMDRLHVRLAALDDPWLIVPTGNYALFALTGKGRVSWCKKEGNHARPGIKAHRGSIYEYCDERGRRVKTIPTIHPASTFRTPGDVGMCRFDWARIAGDAHFRELRLPVREHRIRPSVHEVMDYVGRVLRSAAQLSIDIETPRRHSYETTQRDTSVCVCKHPLKKHMQGVENMRGCNVRRCECEQFRARPGKPRRKKIIEPAYIGCVGFAMSPDESLTIPTTLDYWGNETDHAAAWDAIKQLCESPIDKVLQNGMFDAYWLASDRGITVRNFRWDTRAMHHAVAPNEPHDLAYLASMFTRQPYWKDEAKDPDEIAKYASNSDALWTYNGIDCCVTYEIFERLYERLDTGGMMEFYNEHYAEMIEPLLAISLHGIRVDEALRKSKLSQLESELAALQTVIAEQVGFPLHAKKGLSNDRLKFYLYGLDAVKEKFAANLLKKYPQARSLRFPKQYAKVAGKREKSVTTNEVTIRRLRNAYPERLVRPDDGTAAFVPVRFADVASNILDHRRKRQLSTFVKEGRTDDDGRMRSLYGFVTDTGRLAGQKNPRGTGTNPQNQDREIRDIFVPDAD